MASTGATAGGLCATGWAALQLYVIVFRPHPGREPASASPSLRYRRSLPVLGAVELAPLPLCPPLRGRLPSYSIPSPLALCSSSLMHSPSLSALPSSPPRLSAVRLSAGGGGVRGIVADRGVRLDEGQNKGRIKASRRRARCILLQVLKALRCWLGSTIRQEVNGNDT